MHKSEPLTYLNYGISLTKQVQYQNRCIKCVEPILEVGTVCSGN